MNFYFQKIIISILLIFTIGSDSFAMKGLIHAEEFASQTKEETSTLTAPVSKSGKALMTLNQQGFDVLDDTMIEDSWVIRTLSVFAKEAHRPLLDVGGAYGGITRLLLQSGATVYYNDIERKHLLIGLNRIASDTRKKLYLNSESFPNEMSFEAGSLDAVVLHRVLHFMSPEMAEQGIMNAANWLAPGGKIFIVVLSPEHIAYRDKVSVEYEKRWKEGDRWPGSGMEAKKLLPEQAYCLPELLHVMDERPLAAALKRHGFEVEKSDFISMQRFGVEANRDGRESFGIIAVKISQALSSSK